MRVWVVVVVVVVVGGKVVAIAVVWAVEVAAGWGVVGGGWRDRRFGGDCEGSTG